MHAPLGHSCRERRLPSRMNQRSTQKVPSMEIPAELRRIPPQATLDWITQQFGAGAAVTGVRRLHNAWAAAVHAVDVDDGRGERHELVLRRWARVDLPP